MKPAVSVVVTTYNQACYIEETIRSVFDQTFKDLEVIVVDDGSTDNTPDLLARFRDKITYIRQNNQGVASSRNTGISHSQGAYVALLDGDDVWEPDKLSVQIAAAYDFPESGLIATNGVLFDETGVLQPSLLCDVENDLRLKDDHILTVPYYERCLQANPIWTVSQVMFPRTVLQDIGMSDHRFKWGSDWDLYLRIAEKYDFTFITTRLVKWRYHATSASGSWEIRTLRYKLDHILVLRKQLRTVSEPRHALIRVILDKLISEACKYAYYYGRHHDRLLSIRILLRLISRRALAYVVALSVPARIGDPIIWHMFERHMLNAHDSP